MRKAYFVRKATDLAEVADCTPCTMTGNEVNYRVDKEVVISAKDFDALTNNFFSYDWGEVFEGFKGGWYQEDGVEFRSVIKVRAEEYESVLLIDPQGYEYARYVAFDIE